MILHSSTTLRSLAIALLFLVLISQTIADANPDQETMPDPQTQKKVLALQAFLSEPASSVIKRTCLSATDVEGSHVAFQWGAEPHMTIAAWRVTDAEQTQAIEQLEASGLQQMEPITIACKLERRSDDTSCGFFLVPTEASRAALDAFRQRAMDTLALDFEDFEKRSGVTWWPHITLLGVPLANEAQIEPVLSELRQFEQVTLSVMAIVGFEEGIHTLATVRLSGD